MWATFWCEDCVNQMKHSKVMLRFSRALLLLCSYVSVCWVSWTLEGEIEHFMHDIIGCSMHSSARYRSRLWYLSSSAVAELPILTAPEEDWFFQIVVRLGSMLPASFYITVANWCENDAGIKLWKFIFTTIPSLPCLHTFWHATSTSSYIFNVF